MRSGGCVEARYHLWFLGTMPQHLVGPSLKLGGYFLAEVDQGWLELLVRGGVPRVVEAGVLYSHRLMGKPVLLRLMVGGLIRIVLVVRWSCF